MNKKSIFIVFVILVVGLLVYLSKTFVLDKHNFSKKSVKGTKTQPSIPTLETALKQKLDSVKQEISHLDIKDVASSSPQVQKIINDLNSLKELPSHQAKEICQKICSSL